ncbi:hypothetical protein SDC9_105590 [bioreactor metagenome]|uniref:Uncharacterized protein n=1 Tax=bioreactor metagenome TaxID=1076179 RepID=A0A645B013_9ZZZZ
MRAGKRALVALDAILSDPAGYINGDAAFFILGRSCGNRAVRAELGDGQLVTFLRENRPDELRKVRIVGGLHRNSAVGRRRPGLGILDLFKAGCAKIDRIPVLLDDFVALLAVGFLGGGLHIFDGLLRGNHVGKLEERTLHNRVDTTAHANLASELDGVDVVEL